MKKIVKVFFMCLLCTAAYSQQASEIDPKFVKLPRYANFSAITTATSTLIQNMMGYGVSNCLKLSIMQKMASIFWDISLILENQSKQFKHLLP